MLLPLSLQFALRLALPSALAGNFELHSTEIVDGKPIAAAQVYNGFGCTGGNVSPSLTWSGAPAGTLSFAVLVHDPDAPTGGAGWWHWLVYDLPASTTGLAAGAVVPVGAVQAPTDFGTPGWGGPCPPVGDKPHHYNFTVYAMSVPTLDVPVGAPASLVGFMVNAHSIAKARITGTYGR